MLTKSGPYNFNVRETLFSGFFPVDRFSPKLTSVTERATAVNFKLSTWTRPFETSDVIISDWTETFHGRLPSTDVGFLSVKASLNGMAANQFERRCLNCCHRHSTHGTHASSGNICQQLCC